MESRIAEGGEVLSSPVHFARKLKLDAWGRVKIALVIVEEDAAIPLIHGLNDS